MSDTRYLAIRLILQDAYGKSSEPRPENPYPWKDYPRGDIEDCMNLRHEAFDEGSASRQPEIDRLEAERDEARLETWRIVHKCPSCDRYFDSPSICSDGTYTVEQLERVPDGTWPDQSAQHAVLLDQIKDAYAEGIADTLDRLRVRAAEMLPEVARFTLDEIEVAAVDLSASSTAEKLASLRKRSASASDPMPLALTSCSLHRRWHVRHTATHTTPGPVSLARNGAATGTRA